MNIKDTNHSVRVFLRFSNPYYNNIVKINTENVARKIGFSDNQIFESVMAVDEAYTNAVEHSRNADSELMIEIEYLIFDNRLEVVVKDTGCGFDATNRHISSTVSENSSIRGRGLNLIKCLSDKFELNTSPGIGTEVRIVKYLK